MISIILLIAVTGWLGFSAWHFIDLLQYLQLHEYLNQRYLGWAIGKWRQVTYTGGLLLMPLFILALLVPSVFQYLGFLAGLVLLWVLTWGYTYRQEQRRKAKAIKPLVYTARVKRLIVVGALVIAAEAYGLFMLVFGGSPLASVNWPREISAQAYTFLLLLLVMSELDALNLVIANLILFPVEAVTRIYYVRSAEKIIREINPIVIGITGSYGKTSTKEILYHLLSTQYEVLKTPRTFNTILGVCKVIREELRPTHRYFIVEMGAYKKGEIERICRLVKPQIGILTAIGPQHLERFKTIEAIARAKNELMQALPPEGVAIFNGNDPICRELARQAHGKVVHYGIQGEGDDELDVVASGVRIGLEGTSFEVSVGEVQRQKAQMPLLGRHNVSNALAAISAAMACDLPLKAALRALNTAPVAEHRLQLVRNPSQVVTIDNAYNSNPSGARVALEVLGSFQGGRKFLVTPGFVELGKIQAEEHARLGRLAAQVCDAIFLIGSRDRVNEILKGIRETDYDLQQVYCFSLLREARQKLAELARPGDVVLFENDLTDIY